MLLCVITRSLKISVSYNMPQVKMLIMPFQELVYMATQFDHSPKEFPFLFSDKTVSSGGTVKVLK